MVGRAGGDSFSARIPILRNEGGAAESFALAGADSGGIPSPPCSWLSHFGQTDAKPGEHDGEWLPRRRPGFGLAGIVGHGRRRRWAAVTRYPSHPDGKRSLTVS